MVCDWDIACFSWAVAIEIKVEEIRSILLIQALYFLLCSTQMYTLLSKMDFPFTSWNAVVPQNHTYVSNKVDLHSL